MGQMLQLREMSHEVLGPVNGPNEGYPEYQVPRAVFEMLKAIRQPNDTQNSDRATIAEQNETDLAASPIDPALLGEVQPSGQHTDDSSNINSLTVGDHNPADSLAHNNQLVVDTCETLTATTSTRPITPPDDDTGVETLKAVHQRMPTKRVGKRPQANLSPPKIHQTRNKKKKITDDDLAAMEAANMLQS